MNIYLTTQFAQQYCCVELTRGFDFCAFSWVRRGANSIVYPLAKRIRSSFCINYVILMYQMPILLFYHIIFMRCFIIQFYILK